MPAVHANPGLPGAACQVDPATHHSRLTNARRQTFTHDPRHDDPCSSVIICGHLCFTFLGAQVTRVPMIYDCVALPIDLLRKWPDSLPRARSQPVLAVALHIQQASNPDSILTIPAMIDVFVRCVRRGFLNGSDTIRNRLTCPILCSTRTRNRLSPLLYSFSSSVSWPPFGFLYG